MSSNWLDSIYQLRQQNQSYVLATVISVQGSAPRESGSKFVITDFRSFDSIGGGNLEYQCIDLARALLRDNRQQQHIEHFPLAARLGQCCGGRVTVLFEVFPAQAMNVVLFGAGHVGRALCSILAELPMRISWVDSRAEEFPQHLAANIERVLSENPADEVADMPANACYLVMTHDHQLDMAICEAVVKRADFNYFGVIASESKAGRFRNRLRRKGFDQALIDKMRSPMGLAAVPGKRPMEVAVSIAGELIALAQQQEAPSDKGQAKGIALAEVRALVQPRA